MAKRILITAALIISYLGIYASHIVGGEISYDHISGNKYRIILKVYRDCYNGIPPFDNPAIVGIFNSNDSLMYTMYLTLTPSDTIKSTLNSACFVAPTNVCTEVATYSDTITLPPIPGGYTLAYQRCCRNYVIFNINNPSNSGSTDWTTIPDPSVASGNSSPRFNNYPPLYLCQGAPVKYDHSATDPDGDSLIYSICDTYDAPAAAGGITAPDPPPYVPVSWAAPYSGSYPMSSSPAMAIDPHTGLLTGTPNLIGVWVVGICVNEYRKGVLIGVHHRDFQFNVVDCPGLVVAAVPSVNQLCAGTTINFQNNSFGGTTYRWDFGVKTLTNDTSIQKTPTYAYPDTGVYNVTLVVRSASGCPDTAKATIAVYNPIRAKILSVDEQCINGDGFDFALSPYNMIGGFTKHAVYAWNFDSLAATTAASAANPATSATPSQPHVVYGDTGTYIIKLHIVDHTCTADTTTKIKVVDCRIVVPNVFSPNGDNSNQYFVVKNLNYYPGSKIKIYNRWGRIVYESDNYLNDWDGKNVSDGVYYFILNVSDGRKAIPGFVTILR